MFFFDEVFMKLFNMSFTASWLVLAVVIFRLIFRKAPKWINCAMWLLVALRLIVPFSFESSLSLVPESEPISQESFYYALEPIVESGIEIIDSTVNPIISQTLEASPEASVNPSQIFGMLAGVLWLIGFAVMLLYAAISYISLKRKVRTAVPLKDNQWICDEVKSPFILSFIRPRIYLPSDMSEENLQFVIAHEKAHIRRRDYLWKPIGFILLSVYWFNPLMWFSYILLCRDIELACDERVMKEMDGTNKKAYSEALLCCSVKQKYITACPVAFGEVGVKQRIKAVLNYKKPAFWVILTALVVSIIVGVCFITDPESKLSESNPELDKAVSQAILDTNSKLSWLGECPSEGHIIFGVREKGEKTTVYLIESFNSFGFENGCFISQGGHRVPAVMTFEKTDEGYRFIDVEYAQYGSLNIPSIKKMFPKAYESRALSPTDKDIESMWNQCATYAEAYLKELGREAFIGTYGDIEHVLLTDLGVSVDVSNALLQLKIPYDTGTIGTFEKLENSVRYVYRTSYLADENVILYTKEVYGTNEIVQRIEVDSLTGNIISTNDSANYFDAQVIEVGEERVLVKPFENTKEAEKFISLWVSVKVSSEVPVPVMSEGTYIRVVYDGNILATYPTHLYPSYINNVSAIYLYADVNYVGNTAPKPETTTIAQYVEDTTEPLTTQQPTSSQSDDWGKAVSYLHKTEKDIASLSLFTETKRFSFSLSVFSSYFPRGTYEEDEVYITLYTDDGANTYTFEKGDGILIFKADKSSPMPEYKYDGANKKTTPCITDNALFAYTISNDEMVSTLTEPESDTTHTEAESSTSAEETTVFAESSTENTASQEASALSRKEAGDKQDITEDYTTEFIRDIWTFEDGTILVQAKDWSIHVYDAKNQVIKKEGIKGNYNVKKLNNGIAVLDELNFTYKIYNSKLNLIYQGKLPYSLGEEVSFAISTDGKSIIYCVNEGQKGRNIYADTVSLDSPEKICSLTTDGKIGEVTWIDDFISFDGEKALFYGQYKQKEVYPDEVIMGCCYGTIDLNGKIEKMEDESGLKTYMFKGGNMTVVDIAEMDGIVELWSLDKKLKKVTLKNKNESYGVMASENHKYLVSQEYSAEDSVITVRIYDFSKMKLLYENDFSASGKLDVDFIESESCAYIVKKDQVFKITL